jgi:hypothetical protein
MLFKSHQLQSFHSHTKDTDITLESDVPETWGREIIICRNIYFLLSQYHTQLVPGRTGSAWHPRCPNKFSLDFHAGVATLPRKVGFA